MSTKINDDIDLIEILRKIYKFKKVIFFTTSVFIFIGIFYAMIATVKYKSSTTFIPQNQDNISNPISGVASLVGINLNNSNYGGEIPTSIYPEISESPKFKRLLLNEYINYDGSLKLKDYLIENYKIDDTGEKQKTSIHITEVDEICFNILSEILSINVNQKDGFITISSIMQNPEYAAVTANKAREILQKIIIDNKIESAKQNLIFSENQLNEKKLLFDEIQSKLAFFSDSNLNSVNSFVINEKNKLEAEFEIINAVVTELSKQVEQAKLQVTKDTPVFSTIKEATIPNLRHAPKRTKTVIIFMLIGFISSLFIILLKDLFKKIYFDIVKF